MHKVWLKIFIEKKVFFFCIFVSIVLHLEMICELLLYVADLDTNYTKRLFILHFQTLIIYLCIYIIFSKLFSSLFFIGMCYFPYKKKKTVYFIKLF